MSKTIRIKCKGAGIINMGSLSPLQGALKVLTDENYRKLAAEIESDGFIEPVSVWEDPASAKLYILNGHQRVEALRRMQDSGEWTIPLIPVNYVEADNVADAKRKVLAMASQYGIVNPQGLYDFAVEAGVGKDDIAKHFNFSDFDIDKFMKEYFPQAQPEMATLSESADIIGNSMTPMPVEMPEPRARRETGEISQADFQKFSHRCPRCSFEFD